MLLNTGLNFNFYIFFLWGKGTKFENFRWSRTALTELQVTCSDLHHAVHARSNDESTHISTDKQVTGLCKSRQCKIFKIIFTKIIELEVFLIFLMPWSMHILTEFNLN